jgi:hypothetical protein
VGVVGRYLGVLAPGDLAFGAVNVSQTDGPRPPSAVAPSIWNAEVETPHRKPGGKVGRSTLSTPCWSSPGRGVKFSPRGREILHRFARETRTGYSRYDTLCLKRE